MKREHPRGLNRRARAARLAAKPPELNPRDLAPKPKPPQVVDWVAYDRAAIVDMLRYRLRRLFRMPMSRDDHIEALKRKIRRCQVTIDEIAARYTPDKGHCCPSCAAGPEWHQMVDEQDRREKWLCVLLRKRGAWYDLKLVQAIEMGAWPP